MVKCSRQTSADTTSHQRFVVLTTNGGTIWSKDSKSRSRECSSVGGYQTPSLPYADPVTPIRFRR